MPKASLCEWYFFICYESTKTQIFKKERI